MGEEETASVLASAGLCGSWQAAGTSAGQGCLSSLPASRQAERGSGSRRSPGEQAQERSSPEQLAPKLRLPDTCWQPAEGA